MDRTTLQKELSELFPDEKIEIKSAENNDVKTTLNRELERCELGHLFSLGMNGIKRSGTGLTITFDLTKAHLNTIFKNE